jgi:hypothetical protein
MSDPERSQSGGPAGQQSSASDQTTGSSATLRVMLKDNLRSSPMIAHLMDALESGADIGHYGRLVFAIVARYFLPADEVISWLLKNPGFSEEEAASLMHQIEAHDYSPPTRRRVLEWQRHQDFMICPDPGDPDSCNVYRDLVFPDEVYERIEEYHYLKAAHPGAGMDQGTSPISTASKDAER